MKVLMVSDSYPPLVSGVAQYAFGLRRILQKKGYKVDVLTGGLPGIKDDTFRVGRLIKVPANGTWCWITLGEVFSGTREVLKRGYDVLILIGPLGLTLPYSAMLLSRAPKVGVFLSYTESNPIFSLLRRPLKPFFNMLDTKVAISKAAELSVKRYFGGEFLIIPCGVDTARFKPGASPAIPKDGKKNIVFVGRLDERKGADVLIKAFELVKTPSRLIIVGDGPLRTKLRRMAKGNSSIVFTGKVSDELLPSFYASADICVFPAKGGESFGIVIIEAYASGKPVVASDIEGYREIVKPEAGITSRCNDIWDLAEKMDMLLSCDLGRMGKRAREIAEEIYSWNKVVGKFESILSRLKA